MRDDEAADVVRSIDLAFGLVGWVPGASMLTAVVDQFSAVQTVRAQAMLKSLIDILDQPEHGLISRMSTDERVLRLVAAAVNAAANADTLGKIRTLATVVHRALADDAKLDEAAYLVDILRDLQVIDIRLLLALESADVDREKGVNTASALGVSIGVAESLNAKLLRLAVVETPGMSFRGLHPNVHISPFGREVLSALRDHGSDPLL